MSPAYTSQECPQCGFVHQDNRQGDRFQCWHCHFTAHADIVGAVNVQHCYIYGSRTTGANHASDAQREGQEDLDGDISGQAGV